MKILIAVMSCHKFKSRIDVIRATWLRDVSGADVRFFLGGEGISGETADGEVCLPVPDDYLHLRHKVQAAMGWAVEQGYERVLKIDDDVMVIPSRLLGGVTRHDYVGRVRGPSAERGGDVIYGDKEKGYCSGFSYWLSRRAAEVVASAADNSDWAEDRFVGQILAQAGIIPYPNENFTLWPPMEGHFCTVPNKKCLGCRCVYAQAEVICPHARARVLPELYRWLKETGFVPTWLREEAT